MIAERTQSFVVTGAWVLLCSGAAQAENAEIQAFKDWRVACDNVRLCTALGFTEARGTGPYLWLQRGGTPQDPPTVLVGLGWGEAAEAVQKGATARLRIEGRGSRSDFGAVVDEEPEGGALLVRMPDPSREQAFVEALKNGERIAITAGGKVIGTVSLAGSSASLRWMDDQQGRAGSVTALVARGPAPISALRQPPAEPVIKLVKPRGGEGPTALPKALLNRADVQACIEENADPGGDFSPPQVDRLSEREHLWGVPCGRGAYNFRYRYIIAGRHGSNARSPGLAGYEDTLTNSGLGEDGILGAFNKGRGLGDCGDEAAWAWDGRTFQMIRHTFLDDCQGVPSSLWPRLWTAETE